MENNILFKNGDTHQAPKELKPDSKGKEVNNPAPRRSLEDLHPEIIRETMDVCDYATLSDMLSASPIARRHFKTWMEKKIFVVRKERLWLGPITNYPFLGRRGTLQWVATREAPAHESLAHMRMQLGAAALRTYRRPIGRVPGPEDKVFGVVNDFLRDITCVGSFSPWDTSRYGDTLYNLAFIHEMI